jgi:hypothetical protein
VGVCLAAVSAFRGTAGLAGRIFSSARDAWAALCALCVCVIGRVSRASAAGITWTIRTANAPWAARYGHTSVIDAAGTIYVIGGVALDAPPRPDIYLNDVWASTDGGVRPAYVSGGYLLRGYSGY